MQNGKDLCYRIEVQIERFVDQTENLFIREEAEAASIFLWKRNHRKPGPNLSRLLPSTGLNRSGFRFGCNWLAMITQAM